MSVTGAIVAQIESLGFDVEVCNPAGPVLIVATDRATGKSYTAAGSDEYEAVRTLAEALGIDLEA